MMILIMDVVMMIMMKVVMNDGKYGEGDDDGC